MEPKPGAGTNVIISNDLRIIFQELSFQRFFMERIVCRIVSILLGSLLIYFFPRYFPPYWWAFYILGRAVLIDFILIILIQVLENETMRPF